MTFSAENASPNSRAAWQRSSGTSAPVIRRAKARTRPPVHPKVHESNWNLISNCMILYACIVCFCRCWSVRQRLFVICGSALYELSNMTAWIVLEEPLQCLRSGDKKITPPGNRVVKMPQCLACFIGWETNQKCHVHSQSVDAEEFSQRHSTVFFGSLLVAVSPNGQPSSSFTALRQWQKQTIAGWGS